MNPNENSFSIKFGLPEREFLEFRFSDADWCSSQAGSGDWIQPHVFIRAGGFEGRTSVYLDASDFGRLLPEVRRLYDTLAGEAQFSTLENQVGFKLSGDGKGHIKLQGHLEDKCGLGNRLQFELDYDQTLLWHSIADLQRFLDRS